MEKVLLYFSLLHFGDWQKIYNSIASLEKVDETLLAQKVDALSCSYITLLSSEYPDELRHIDKPPFVLYYKGDISLLQKEKKISIVGSRKRSEYGKTIATNISRELYLANYVVVSGLAKGIDADAHQAALSKTIAVLPCGIDNIYPQENTQLKEDIIESGGLVISEYPSDITARKDSFPFRNRIIAGLGKAVLVVEAGAHSGTSITVSYALEFGKEIFAIPHRIGSGNTNSLIKQGAILVENAQDIIDYLDK